MQKTRECGLTCPAQGPLPEPLSDLAGALLKCSFYPGLAGRRHSCAPDTETSNAPIYPSGLAWVEGGAQKGKPSL